MLSEDGRRDARVKAAMTGMRDGSSSWVQNKLFRRKMVHSGLNNRCKGGGLWSPATDRDRVRATDRVRIRIRVRVRGRGRGRGRGLF